MNKSCHMAVVLREVSQGSEAAFELFYERYAPLVLRIAVKMLGDRMEAEDMCHEVLLEAIRKSDKYDAAKGSVDAWIAVMARSRCLDRLRKQKKRAAAELLDRDRLPEPGVSLAAEEAAIGRIQQKIIREELTKLPEAQRNAIAAAYFRDKTQSQIAREWQVPLGTVKSWIRYGLGNLRKQLSKKGWQEAGEGSETYESN
ncbi:RNA polymerase sigma factor [Paenibacillus chungangensis]|uniref:RNA polymerase sigma factor n=1 Tax=Paenibacillus chungangensis TaxID=696535 RepID=A0ABW3HYH2_9BACL